MTMKVSQLTAELRKAGCFLLRHGARHDIWMNPANGGKAPVPRHGSDEVKTKTLQNIYNGLFGQKPE